MHRPLLGALFALTLVALSAPAAPAQIADNLSSYSTPNAVGYLQPLKDALGSALADGLHPGGGVAQDGVKVRFSLQAMLVSFADEDRSFTATTEDGFPAPQQVEAPTVVGSTSSTQVSDAGSGATFTFPGGLDLDRLGLAVPQLTVSGFSGSEATLRYLAFETGDNEIGDVSIFGLGGRHDLSRYLPPMPVRLAAMAFYQKLSFGDDLIDHSVFSLGVQGSRRFQWVEPYAGLSLDSSGMTVSYDDTSGEAVEAEFDRENQLHLALGSALHLGPVHLNGEIHVAGQTSFAFGFSVGN